MHSQVSTTRRQFVLTILRQIQTPQEVVVWFGCGHEKKKKERNSFGLVNKRFGLLPVWGKSLSYPGSCMARVRILIAGIERVQ